MSKKNNWNPIPHKSTSVPFPKKLLDVLPDPIRIFIISAAIALQCDIGLVLGSFLGTLSSIATGRVRVQPQPTHRPNRREAAQLYIFLCADPGESKTTSLDFCSKPLYERLCPIYSAESYMDSATKRLSLEAEANLAKSILSPSESPVSAIRDLQMTEAEVERFKPYTHTTLISDFTPEGLVRDLLPSHGYGIILTDEPDALAVLSGNLYSRNGFVNLGIITAGFSNGRYFVTRSKGRIALPQVALSITIGTQPKDFHKCISKLIGRGVPERFIYFVPPTLAGSRLPYTEEAPDDIINQYTKTIDDLIYEIIEGDSIKTLPFSPEAEAAYERYYSVIEARRKEGGDLRDTRIVGWSERIKSTPVRIAALFALYLGEETVSLDCWHAAECITLDYLIPCAKAALGISFLSLSALSLIPYLINNESIEQADLYRRVHLLTAFKDDKNAFDLALQELEANGLIRIAKSPRPATRGRKPAPVIYIHPDINKVS